MEPARRATGSRSLPIVLKKQGNRTRLDPVEGRGSRNMESLMGNTKGTRMPKDVSTKQQRIARLAQRHADRPFLSLNHYIDIKWLREAYRRTRKDGAAGIDGKTAQEYGERLDENLESLLSRAKSGSYRAPAVKRAHIPKGSGKGTRPIGVPTIEDKVMQRAVVMALEPICEQYFLDCSYGFRPGRSQHQALESLWKEIMSMGGCWMIEIDIQSFFDTMDKAVLREIVKQRVSDGVINRLIGKWLKAGVMEEGRIGYPEAGTPQGGVISPLLANMYLHDVLDEWFEETVKGHMKGKCFMIRFADDAILGFSMESDARKVREVLPKRFAKYGLKLHPEKTRLVHFKPQGKDGERPGTFDFLGFTHYWGKSRQGHAVVKRKTAKDRLKRSMRKVYQWCKRNRHVKVKEQHRQLCLKLRGHYNYYGITGNLKMLRTFYLEVKKTWIKWLGRRSQKSYINWEKAENLLSHYVLPPARIYHSYCGSSAKP
jgi:RNA-directed DNA polymerase